MISLRLTIDAPPRTKKTHQRIQRFGKFNKVVPSEAWIAFRNAAVPQLKRQLIMQPGILHSSVSVPVTVNAQVFRDARRGDLVGYLTSIADVLQEAGVVVNDVVIQSWDGSRMRIDRKRPRVELVIEELVGEDIDDG